MVVFNFELRALYVPQQVLQVGDHRPVERNKQGISAMIRRLVGQIQGPENRKRRFAATGGA